MIEALAGPLAPVHVLVAASRPAAPELLDAAERAGVDVFAVEDRVFGDLSDAVTPQPALAVLAAPSLALDHRFTGTGRRRLLVLVDVADPGNVGTIVRTAEASGFDGVVTTGSTADPLSPKAVRASAGSVLRVPVAEAVDALDELTDAGVDTVATVVEGPPDDAAALDGDRVAIVLGSEAHGLPAEVMAQCSSRVGIPMAGQVESLNVATVGAVLAFDLARRDRQR